MKRMRQIVGTCTRDSLRGSFALVCRVGLAATVALVVASCGQKGPLALPERTSRPATPVPATPAPAPAELESSDTLYTTPR